MTESRKSDISKDSESSNVNELTQHVRYETEICIGTVHRGLTINHTEPHRAVPDRIWLTRPYPYYDKLQE